MQSSMAAIPEDVIIAILCILPVNTLLRFRCVSKQFRSIIDDPDFIKRHLQNQNHHSLNRRLIVQGILAPGPFSVDLDSADNTFKLDLPFELRESRFFVIGSCDGLLALLLDGKRRVCLWNISTRKHQILPVFWSDFDTELVFDGFGYDVSTDDYKWVRVISDTKSMTEVTVFSLKANSWRRIENYPPYHDYTVTSIGVLVGSSLNWNVRVEDIAGSRVMAFDLKDEKFYEVSLPDIEDVAEAEATFDIVILEGFLCLCYFNSFETALDVWVMKEYGVKESWTRLFRLPKETLPRFWGFDRRIIAFSCSKSSNKVLVYPGRGEVFWHELDKNTDEIVEINKWPGFIMLTTLYIDSLVSPKISI